MELEVAPYPAHWEADVLLRDGTTMRIRPILPTDADALQAFHVGQSEESTYFRFFAPLRRLSDRDLRRLVKVDHTDRVALVVLDGEAIVAVARFDRVTPHSAEVAFNVADALQGQGLGSVLLEHLAAAARERGVTTFQADVLPGNAKMIRVFDDAGYDVVQRYEDGVISLEFTIDPTQRSLDVVASREHRTDAASMRQFLAPERVVVLGGSAESELAARVAANLAGQVEVTCVGEALREEAERLGHHWCSEVEDVTGPACELAVVAAAPQEVLGLLAPLAQVGVRGVVVLSDGFDGEGPAAGPGIGLPARGARSTPTQRALLRAARAAGVRLIGPRSLGVVTATERGVVNATLDPHPPSAGGAALFSQSSPIGMTLLDLVGAYGLGVSTFVSAGQRADVSGNDLLQYAADLPGVRAVALYLESLGNARKFARVAQRVSASVPVVAVVGASQREEAHRGLGRRAMTEAMLAAGVIVTSSLRAMVETTQLLVGQGLPAGSRIAVLSNSEAIAELAAAQVGHLDPAARIHTVGWTANEEEFAHAADSLGADEDWDAALVLYTPPLGAVPSGILDATARLGAGERPVLAVIPGVVGLTEPLTGCEGRTVPGYGSVEDAVVALTHAAGYASWRRTDLGSLVEPPDMAMREARELVASALASVPAGQHVELDRAATAALLASLGIEMLPTRSAQGAREALEAAIEVGWPVVVKSSDQHLRRRADLGGVRLDVSGPIDLVDAVRQVRSRQGGTGPVLIQRMAPLGVACLVRGWVDSVVGPVITFGLTGDATDLLGDAGYALPPLRTGEVHRLVNSVRTAARLHGDGHTPGVDVPALEDLVARVADALDTLPQVHSLELRPVLASPSGAVVLDARVVLAAQVRPDGGRRALRG